MSDEHQLRDEVMGVKLEVQQMRSELRDLRSVLVSERGGSGSHDADVDCKRIIQDGARAYLTGLTTSPHRENSKEEDWWRLGWQLSKDAVKSARREWT